MYRILLYPLIVAVAASGLVGGRWLEQSGLLYGLIERGGTAVGVPERVFREGPGQPPPEADAPAPAAPEEQAPSPTGPADEEPVPDDTSEPVEEEPAVEETTEEQTTETPSPAPTTG